MINAVSHGKYPSPPALDLYFVTSGRPGNRVVIEFLRWVLRDGQKFVNETGFIKLSEETLQKERKKI
jgi:phosphate transport system substrate-binding protein